MWNAIFDRTTTYSKIANNEYTENKENQGKDKADLDLTSGFAVIVVPDKAVAG